MNKTFAMLLSLFVLACSSLILAGCEREKPPPAGERAGPKIRTATERVKMTPEAIEEAMAQMKRKAREERRQWAGKTFKEFEQSVYKEPFEGGKYIVSGDIAISDRKQLEEFFETRIKQEPPETRPGALIVHQAGGQDAIWNSTQKRQLTYCVSTTFGNRHQQIVTDMDAATSAWEKTSDVDFLHVASQDGNCTAGNANVVFDVRPVNVNGQYLARAFFPNEPRSERNVLIDESSFQLDPNGNLKLVGILRHELGHTLGWRHEHTRPESGTCFEDNDWRPLTGYDRFSVMHYPQCNGGGDWSLLLTHMDQNGAACLYGAAPGFQVDPQICASPPTPQGGECRVNVQTSNGEKVASGQEKGYGPFTVSPGTMFEAKITGSGSSPGDPDLYVRFGSAPQRSPGGFSCRPYLTGAEETCSLDVPAGQKQAFVMVHGYAAGSYNLRVTFTGGGQP
jgi:serine protease